MSLDLAFQKACESVKTDCPSKPSNDDLLMLYGWYKQATEGSYKNGSKPGMFDMAGKAKYAAWKAVEGVSADDCKKKYIAKASSLTGKQYGA